jgi:hypothetical protein
MRLMEVTTARIVVKKAGLHGNGHMMMLDDA